MVKQTVWGKSHLPVPMLRSTALVATLAIWLAGVAPISAQLPTDAQRKETLEYLYSLQKPDGSFGPSVLVPKSDLPTTSAVVRAIIYLGGQVPNADKTRQYLHSCQNTDGGFAASPGGSSEVRTTALAVLGLVELGEKNKVVLGRAAKYLETHAKSFEDIRIAAAAFEAMQLRPSNKTLKTWQLEIVRGRNSDGTFGQGGDVARDTGSAVACLLRLGLAVQNEDVVAKAMIQGQQSDGGWGRGGQPSDLESTYRVMRALYMLKQKPNLEAVAKFVASCRTNEGAYSLRPAEAASPQATYFASAILRWIQNWPR